MTARLGSNFGERYRVVRLLGQGGMGQVYEAEQRTLGRRVAMKRVLDGNADAVARQRLEKEARALAQVHSPHVVQVFDTDEDETGLVVIMELLQGVTFAARLAEGATSQREVVEIVRDAAMGLAAAHAAGVVHRDVKPENIFLAEQGDSRTVKVIDFGIAKDASFDADRTSPSAMVGTPRYMAPEYIQGRTPTAAVDIFALGVVLYHALSGAWPYESESTARYIYAVIGKKQVPITTRLPQLSEALAQVVARCLAPDPRERYVTAVALVADLNAALPMLEAPARAAPVRESRPAYRTRAIAAMLVVTLALAAGAGLARRAPSAVPVDTEPGASERVEVARVRSIAPASSASSSQASASAPATVGMASAPTPPSTMRAREATRASAQPSAERAPGEKRGALPIDQRPPLL